MKLPSSDVFLVATPGGHFKSLQLLKSGYEEFNYHLLTYSSVVSSEAEKTIGMKRIQFENIISLYFLLNSILLSVQVIWYIIYYRPNIIISTGGEIAAPALYLGRLAGCRLVFIEDVSRTESPSLTGRLVYPIVHEFWVQDKQLVDIYGDKAEFHGEIL